MFVPKGPINNIPALVQIMTWWQAIIWTNDDPVHQHIYATLRGDGLINPVFSSNTDTSYEHKNVKFITSRTS